MQICFFEDTEVPHLLPLVRTRPIYDLRLGQRTMLERLVDALDAEDPILHVREDLTQVTAAEHPGRTVNPHEIARADAAASPGDLLLINGRLAPADPAAVTSIREAADAGEHVRLLDGDTLVAARIPRDRFSEIRGTLLDRDTFSDLPERTVESPPRVGRLWDLIDGLSDRITEDLDRLLRERGPQVPEQTIRRSGGAVVAPNRIQCASSATLKPGVILNAEDGPIVIDRDAVVQERAVLRGPLYLGPQSRAKIGARLEASAFGTYCKAGGEVEHTVMHAYANKAHEGFLGHSYISPWCNLAADTNTSNLKNDYGDVAVYDVAEGDFVDSGQQFLGLFMADHSKCGINTMFNTGTVIGVFCNIFGVDYPPRFVPSFSWGEYEFAPYRIEKALEVAERVMARRDETMGEADEQLLRRIYKETHESPAVSR